MADVTATNQCPHCMGVLSFSPESGLLVCEFCESTFTPAEIEALMASKLEKAADAFERQEAAEKEAAAAAIAAAAAAMAGEGEGEEKLSKKERKRRKKKAAKELEEALIAADEANYRPATWDSSTIADDWGEDGSGIRAFTCSSCGGEIICEETTAATQCPFCGNNTVVPGQFSIGMKPNLVIPFKLTKPQAEAALRRHYRGKPFLPSEFSSKNQINKLQGTYVPFFLFKGDCRADVTFDATNSSEERDGDYVITTTEHYEVERRGTVPFDRIPIDASSKMPDSMMESLEPFDYDELMPFTTSVFAGFIADKYDVGLNRCAKRADDRCESTVIEHLRDDVDGYDSVAVERANISMDKAHVDYALLPVYTMKTQFEGRSYLFAMNGQTGKLVGDLPVSKKKFWMMCAGLTVVLGIVLFALGAGGALADFVWEVIAEG